MNNLISIKSRAFRSLVDPSKTRKSQFIWNWIKIRIFLEKLDKIDFFHQHSQPLYVMQKEIENLELVQTVNIEFTDSTKTNGLKYLLIFDDSC